jgi:cell division septation protein DedD
MTSRFVLGLRAVVLLGAGVLLVGALTFVVGLASGILWAKPATSPAGAKPPAAKPAVAPPAIEPPSAPAAADPLPAPETIFEVELGSFLVPADATSFVAALAKQGVAAYVVAIEASGGRALSTVRIGPYPSMEAAAAAAAAARARLGGEPVVRFRLKPAEQAGSG